MDIRTFFLPEFLQQCPCCGQTIDVRALRKLESEKAARWYQSSIPYLNACPECGEFVKVNIENSPWFAVALLLLFSGIVSSWLWPQASSFINSIPGRLAGILIGVLLVWLAIKHSVLVRDLRGFQTGA